MKKKDLLEFIEGKTHAERNKMLDEVRDTVDTRLEPVIEDLFTQMELVEERAKNLVESYTKALEPFGLDNDWNQLKIVSEIRYNLIGWSRNKRDNIRRRIYNAVLNPNSDAYKNMLNLNKFKPQIVEIAEELIKEHEPLRKKLSEFDILRKELENIVKNAPSAKKAYNQLKDLGVDMSGFKEAEEMLPAVIKLSVDPCLINGGCA